MKNLIQRVRLTLEKQQRLIKQQKMTIVAQGEIIRQLNGAIEIAKQTKADDKETISVLMDNCFALESALKSRPRLTVVK